MTPPLISSLLPYEVTRELLTLAASAPVYERRVWLLAITGHPPTLSDRETYDELCRLIGEMPDDERALNLYLARRWCGEGLRAYQALDPLRDRRDWDAEQAAEAADGLFYSSVPIVMGRTSQRRFDAWVELTREIVAEQLKHGAI